MQLDLRSNLSDEDAPPGVLWNIFYFQMCKSLSLEKVLWVISCILSFAIGLPACVLILRKMWKPRRGGTPLTPNNLFILHLTIMDTIFLASVPVGIFNNMIFYFLIVESVLNGLYSFNVCGRPLMMACMCLDCYVAVVHPITYHKRKSMTPRIVMICFAWLCSFATGVAFFLSSKHFFLISLVPFAIITVTVGISDSFIIHALLKSKTNKTNLKLQKKRAVKTLINSLVMTMLFYFTPILTQIVFKVTMGGDASDCVNGFLASALSTLGSGVMPILNVINRRKCGCCSFRCSQLDIWCCPKRGTLDLGKSTSC